MEHKKYYFCRNPQKNQKDGSVPYHKKLAVLSNFEDKHPIKLDNGKIALTAEHYFQAYKHKIILVYSMKFFKHEQKQVKFHPVLPNV
tara:strand:+ start:610 stop:870 length:261 start_codon:yes stop_codon:yes gene_type:complete